MAARRGRDGRRHRLLVRVAAALAVAGATLPVVPAGAVSYTLTLSASTAMLETDYYSSLTVDANVAPAGNLDIYVFDQTTGAYIGDCWATSCTYDYITQSVPGTHTYIAYVARSTCCPSFPPMGIQATSNTRSITWTPSSFQVSLSASPTTTNPGTSSTLSAQANKDVGPTAAGIFIFDQTTGAQVALCGWGTLCQASVTQDAITTHTYVADVADYWSSGYPPSGIQATSNTVTVTWAPVVATGSAAFHGTAELSRFPCQPPPPFGDGPCTGSFGGDWAGNLSGAQGTNPYSVSWTTASGSAVHASFQYAEWQCLDGVESALGFAVGSGTASAGPGAVQGKWQVPGEAFPRDVVGVDATFQFTWTRVGNAAVIMLSPMALTVTVSGLGAQTVITSGQNGAASFAVTSSANTTAPTCATPLDDVQGAIAGTIALVATSH